VNLDDSGWKRISRVRVGLPLFFDVEDEDSRLDRIRTVLRNNMECFAAWNSIGCTLIPSDEVGYGEDEIFFEDLDETFRAKRPICVIRADARMSKT
jgi:hypothetical protein